MKLSGSSLSNRILLLIVFVLGIYFLNFPKSYATRELHESTLVIAKRSEAIVVARCISSESKWNDEGTLIFTYITFKIEDTIDGENLDEFLTLRLIGGQVGDVVQTVIDRPEFNEDEEVVLFIGPKNKDGYQTITSLNNGALRISTDRHSGQKFITTPVTGFTINKENTNLKASFVKEKGVLLEDFVYNLKRAINQ